MIIPRLLDCASVTQRVGNLPFRVSTNGLRDRRTRHRSTATGVSHGELRAETEANYEVALAEILGHCVAHPH
jgi:hypothetical protein